MKKGLIEVLFYIVLVFGVSFLLTTYVGQRTRVNESRCIRRCMTMTI